MSKRNNAMDFPTNRDRDAFGEVIKRSNLSYAKGEFYRVEFVGNPIDADCRNCQCGHGNVRLVFNYGGDAKHDNRIPAKFGSDTYCLSCFKSEMRDWFDAMFDAIDEQYSEYRSEQQ